MDNELHKQYRKIIHIDMDAFYASIEQRDNPDYRGKPLIVGGPAEGRGVVATASYEARKFGVRSAMASWKALQLCPKAIVVSPRFDVYKEVSQRIREIFRRYTDIIEPLSLDEAYLDVTEDKQNIGYAIEVAKQIKQAIKEELQLTASAGVSINKFIAKIASDVRKPDGLTFVGPSRVEAFMEALPVEKFHGVGKVTAEKMKRMGVHTGADMKKLTEAELAKHFGKNGRFYYKIVRGIDDRMVQARREIKSISAEDTFPYDLTDLQEMNNALDKIAGTVHERLSKRNLKGRTITLKIKYSDFSQISRSQSFPYALIDLAVIQTAAKQLLITVDWQEQPIRLLGIGISNFGTLPAGSRSDEEEGQLELF